MTETPKEYSGFGVRLIAWLIDGLLLGVAMGVVMTPLLIGLIGGLTAVASRSVTEGGDLDDAEIAAMVLAATGAIFLIAVLAFVVQVLYLVLFTGLKGQTPGKMFMGIKVVDEQGGVPGIGRAIMREVIGKFLSGLLFDLGFLWAAWDPQRQTWHDKIATTWVV
ncbi:MAG: RDD family protein, partial [Chloroflexota bacterium]